MGIIERIKEIEAEMARTQKNKATGEFLSCPFRILCYSIRNLRTWPSKYQLKKNDTLLSLLYPIFKVFIYNVLTEDDIFLL